MASPVLAPQLRRNQAAAAVAAAALLAALGWAYLDVLAGMARKWESDPQYSHGYLVPLFAGVLLYLRRSQIRGVTLRPSVFGLALLAAGLAAWHVSSYVYIVWFEQLSLILCVAGAVLSVGGWVALRWAWPACLFLIFMVPLPFTLEVALRDPLRSLGTVASCYVMQTIGLPAYSEGTVIVVNDVRIGVVEACSGLRMLMTFFALATAAALLGDQPVWRRGVLVASAVPIAIATNIARITATGSLYALGYHEFAEKVFHDLAGFLMMILGLLLLWAEWALLDRLFVAETEDRTEAASVALAGVGVPERRHARRAVAADSLPTP